MRTTTERNGRQAPEGYHWVAEPEHTSGYMAWRIAEEARPCRYGASPGHRACAVPSVARLNRGRSGLGDRWWHYCSEHLFGRWVEGGCVYHWVLRDIPDTDTERTTP